VNNHPMNGPPVARSHLLLAGLLSAAWVVSLSACSEAPLPGVKTERSEHSATRVSEGPYPVGTVRIELAVDEGRVVPVQLWYPAVESARAEAARGRPLAEIEPEGPERTLLRAQLESAPSPGTSHVFHAADGPEPADLGERFPLVLFSHCNECVRYSSLTVAEHLASLGFVVAAPDHVNGTLYDLLNDTSVGLDFNFLPQRVRDVTALLDTLLDEGASVVPESLRGRLDGERVGMMGHSFGGITSGLVLQNDPRVSAAAILAIPLAVTGLLAALQSNVEFAEPSEMTKPVLFVKAAEDIALLNGMLDDDYARYGGEAWRVTIRDTSHYSVTDICGITPTYDLGSCSPGLRSTLPLVPFTPLDIKRARALTADYVAAFFRQQLLGEGDGPGAIARSPEVRIEHKE
jgi:dienelactone hydrolase